MSRQVAEQDVEFRLFGRFVVLRGGVEVPVTCFGGRKVRALLRILVTRRGCFLPHDVLAERLWPDRLPADPAAISRCSSTVRVAPSAGPIHPHWPWRVRPDRRPWLTVDVDQYLEDLRRCAGLSGHPAVQAYRATLAVGDAEALAEDRYASWAAPYVDAVLPARQCAWERAASLALESGQPAPAVEWARAAHRAEPLREVAALVLAQWGGGGGRSGRRVVDLDVLPSTAGRRARCGRLTGGGWASS